MKLRKYYKDYLTIRNMHAKRGQVAIFVIIALAIVTLIALIYIIQNRIITPTNQVFTPAGYLKECISPHLKTNLDLIAKQGGYTNPEGYVLYQGEKIKYLCHTSEYYKTCVVQQPLLKEHVESELNSLINIKVKECALDLKAEYERQGYAVSLGNVDSRVSITPANINVNLVTSFTISKESTQQFKEFDVRIPSQIYDLLLTATSIISYESVLGDSETTLYIRYYPNLKVEKVKLSDGSKVYTLSNVVTNEQFRFASRSLSWPPGYGVE